MYDEQEEMDYFDKQMEQYNLRLNESKEDKSKGYKTFLKEVEDVFSELDRENYDD